MWRKVVALELCLFRLSRLSWLLAAAVAGLGAMLALGKLDAVPALVSPPSAPYAFAYSLAVLSWAILAIAMVPVSCSALRDDEFRAMELLRAIVGRRQYALGHAAVALIVTLTLMFCGAAGYALAMVGGDPAALIKVAALVALPNAALIGALIFAAAALGRSLAVSWLAAAALLGLMVVGIGDPDLKRAGLLLDPFALRIIVDDLLALLPAERATASLQMTYTLLANRALWLAVTIVLLAPAVAFAYRRVSAAPPAKGASGGSLLWFPDRPVALAQLVRLTAFNLTFLLRSLLVRIGLLVLVLSLLDGTGAIAPPFFLPNLPTTAEVLGRLAGNYQRAAMIWIALVAIDLGQREQDQRMKDVSDLLPVSVGAWLLARVIALCTVVLLLQGVAVAGIIWLSGASASSQLLLGALMSVLPIALAAGAAAAIQAWAGSRYGAYLWVLLLAGLCFALSGLALSPGLVQFARLPSLHSSDMLGLTEPLDRWLAYAGYWLLAVAVLWVATLARRRLWAALLAAVWLGAGIWLYVQSTPAVPTDDGWRVAYERAMRPYAEALRPDIAKVKLAAYFDPDRRAVRVEGEQTYQFEGVGAVRELAFSLPVGSELRLDVLAPHDVIAEGTGYRIVALATPLVAGRELRVRYATTLRAARFAPNPMLTTQGMSLLSTQFQPSLNYETDYEVMSPDRRIRLGLTGTPSRSGPESIEPRRLLGTGNARRIAFEARLVVPAGWSAVAPGALRSTASREHNGRREFVFVADHPITPAFVLAAHPWQEKSVASSGTELRLLYAPAHMENLQRIQATATAALARFGALFGDYPYANLTIAEVPNGSLDPISQPGTILLPEIAGYVQDLRMQGFTGRVQERIAVDPTVLVVGHEIAHQWWGLQFSAAESPGGAWLTESIAQYFALSLLKDLQGSHRLRAALRQQHAEYFDGRRRGGRECALATCVYLPPHLAYAKGGLAWMVLEDALGREALQAALGEIYRQQQGFALGKDVLSTLKQKFPDHRGLIEQLFERVVTHRLAIRSAAPTIDGKQLWLTLELSTQSDVPVAIEEARRVWFEVQKKDGEPLSRRVLTLLPGTHQVEVPLPGGASQVVVDPDFLLLDASRDDNVAYW